MYANKVKAVEVEIPDRENPPDYSEEEKVAIDAYLKLEITHRKELILVTGLAKQRSDASDAERLEANPEYKKHEPKTVVRPTTYVILQQPQFLELFALFRQAAWEVYNRTCLPEMKAEVPSLNDISMFSFDKTRLQTDETINSLTDIANRRANTIVQELRHKLDIAKPNNTGTHFLRKIYTMYTYHLYGARDVKDVYYAMAVLGHRDLGTSARYTDLIIERPITHGSQITLNDAMLTKLSGLIAQVDRVEDAQLAEVFDITPLPIKRFTEEEKDNGEHTTRVMNAMRRWPLTVGLTQRNMRQLKIGQTLMMLVRNSDEFKQLKETRAEEIVELGIQ